MNDSIIEFLMTDSIIPIFSLENIRLVSSTKCGWLTLDDWLYCFFYPLMTYAHRRSLMDRRNNKGPKVDSWQKPYVTVLISQETPWRETYCLRFLKKELNQLSADP